MKNKRLLPLFFFFLYLLKSDCSYAGAVLYRIQMMKAQKQHQQQLEYQAAYQQQYQQQNPQTQNQASQPQTYEQTIDQRNQAIAQAILDAHNLSVATTSPGLPPTQSQTSVPVVVPHSPNTTGTTASNVTETVDLTEVWKKLDNKSAIWTALIDQQDKIATVSEYIGRFQSQGVKISAPPQHYVQEIDQIVHDSPQMLERPFGELLKTVAIVDYDFDNGMDRDALAKAVLGDAGFEENKKRFSQQQPQQQQ